MLAASRSGTILSHAVVMRLRWRTQTRERDTERAGYKEARDSTHQSKVRENHTTAARIDVDEVFYARVG